MLKDREEDSNQKETLTGTLITVVAVLWDIVCFLCEQVMKLIGAAGVVLLVAFILFYLFAVKIF